MSIKDIEAMKKLYAYLTEESLYQDDAFKSPAAIIVCGDVNMELAGEAAKEAALYPDAKIIVCGKNNDFSKLMLGGRTEASFIGELLERNGCPKDRIILEEESTSTRQNLDNALAIIENLGISGKNKNLVVVSKNLSYKRTRMLAQEHLKDYNLKVTAPAVKFEDYNNDQTLLGEKGDYTVLGHFLVQLYEQTVSIEKPETFARSDALEKMQDGTEADKAFAHLALSGYCASGRQTQELLKKNGNTGALETAQKHFKTFLAWLMPRVGKSVEFAFSRENPPSQSPLLLPLRAKGNKR